MRGTKMADLLETRVKGLDKALGGGLPGGTSILLTTETPEKTGFFCLDFLYRGLASKQPAMMITTDKSPEEIKIDAVKRGQTFVRFEEKFMRWIDVYSIPAGRSPDENPAINRVSSYLSLYDITISASIFQSNFYKLNQCHRVVLDSLSTLIVRNNSQTVMRFMQVLTEKTKKAGGSLIYVLKKGLYAHLEPELEKMVDAHFDMVQTDKGTVFKILKFPSEVSRKELNLKVTRTGVELG